MADDFGMGYALGADSGGGNGMFGGDGWIGLLLFAMIFGGGWGGCFSAFDERCAQGKLNKRGW